MPQPTCSKGLYPKDGNCCKWCQKGTYKVRDCDQTAETQCKPCEPGHFMDTINHRDNCRSCKTCNSSNNQKTLQECTHQTDAVCGCVDGYYCTDSECTHCLLLTSCSEGYGVKTKATRTTNVICSKCESGTFSNVSDHHSPCKPHTRCEDIGRELQFSGNETRDAVCGNFKTAACPWILPAGLWAGLVLTSVLVFAVAVFCWRTKRHRFYRDVNIFPPEAPVDVALVADEMKLPLPSKETPPSYSCDLPVYSLGDEQISCDGLDFKDSIPITPLKVSVSFLDSPSLNQRSGFCTGNFKRTISEPQEDEWCGT